MLPAPPASSAHPPHRITRLRDPLTLDCGATLHDVDLAWAAWGKPTRNHSNVILLFPGVTGDQYAAGAHPITQRQGWWDHLIGSGKALDTDRFYVVCLNVLGGCMGSTGPAAPAPSGKPWGLSLPPISIADMARAALRLTSEIGVERLFCVLGGSMGGMLALQCAVMAPERIFAVAPIATSWRQSAQNIAFHEVGRQAIMADPNWHEGDYALHGVRPRKGLAVARMGAHITYMAEEGLQRRFGRARADADAQAPFEVESYLRHQGSTFVDRFDANSYLYLTRAMDGFDLSQHGSLANVFSSARSRFGVFAFSSDWLYPTRESRTITQALLAAGATVSFVELPSDRGHDAFLIDEVPFQRALAGFLDGAAREHGLAQ